MTASILPEGRKPGIYFGLSEEEYHLDPAFGSSDVRNMEVSSLYGWHHKFGEGKAEAETEEGTTPAMSFGKALHSFLLEPAAFNEKFVSQYVPTGDELATSEDIGKWLGEAGLKKSGKKEELIARALEADPDLKILDVERKRYAELHAGKKLISPEWDGKLKGAHDIIQRHPEFQQIFSTAGYSEVSFFWIDEETGLPCKCRHDRLNLKASIEVKTISNSREKPFSRAVADAIAEYKYHVSGAMYRDGREKVRQLMAGTGCVLEGDVDEAWLQKFIAFADARFIMMFVESSAPHNITGRELKAIGWDGHPTNYYAIGQHKYRAGLLEIKRCLDQYGLEPWTEFEPIRALEDNDCPAWMFS